MNYSHLIHERSLTTTPHRQKPIIEPPDYPVVFLTQKKQVGQSSTCLFCGVDAGFALQRLLPKVNRVQPKGFTRQCRVAVYKIAINPRFDDIKKQVEQGSTCLLCVCDYLF